MSPCSRAMGASRLLVHWNTGKFSTGHRDSFLCSGNSASKKLHEVTKPSEALDQSSDVEAAHVEVSRPTANSSKHRDKFLTRAKETADFLDLVLGPRKIANQGSIYVPAAGLSLRNFVGRQRASRLRQPTAYKDQVPQTQREQPVPNRWVFLGCPGSGKGTFGSKLAGLLEIPHISMGDLVRQGLAGGNGPAAAYGQALKQGKLLPDDVILQLLFGRLKDELLPGKGGFVLDGFPRTVNQAEILEQVLPIEKVVNLRMREDVLISKCLGRRMCSQCGSSFNLADVDVAGADGVPRIRMAPLLPPPACLDKMVTRADDTEEVVKKRLQVYYQQSQPVEEFYRSQGKLLEFQNEGSIGETWSRLLAELNLPVKRQFFDKTQDHKSSNRCVVPGAL